MFRLLQVNSRILVVLLVALTVASCSSGKSSSYRPEYSEFYSYSDRIEVARNGNLHALHKVLARSLYMSESGMTVHPMGDLRNPLEWLQKGVDREDALSQARMAYYVMYSPRTRHDPEHNPERALQLAQAALANTTLPLGTRNTHSKAYETARQADAEKLTREVTELARRIETVLQQQSLAEKGDAEAAYAMSQAYGPFDVELLWYKAPEFSGNRGVHIRWLRRAAEAGHPDAIHGMVAVAPDSEKRTWEIKAARLKARHENLTAQEMFELGNRLMDSRQEAEALKWYMQAAEKGIQPAQKIVLQHTDPTVVRLKAIGDANAMFELGEYFRAGNWEGKELKVAHEWYLKASARGVAEASYQAALAGPVSEREQLMQRAAEQGHVEAGQWLATVRNDRAQKVEREKQAAEAQQQRQADLQAAEQAAQRAFVAHIDQHGSADRYQIEVYCNYGGRRCNELRNAELRAQAQRNRAGTTYGSQEQDEASRRSNEAMQRRSECLRKKVESLERYNRGQQSWHYSEDC